MTTRSFCASTCSCLCPEVLQNVYINKVYMQQTCKQPTCITMQRTQCHMFQIERNGFGQPRPAMALPSSWDSMTNLYKGSGAGPLRLSLEQKHSQLVLIVAHLPAPSQPHCAPNWRQAARGHWLSKRNLIFGDIDQLIFNPSYIAKVMKDQNTTPTNALAPLPRTLLKQPCEESKA